MKVVLCVASNSDRILRFLDNIECVIRGVSDTIIVSDTGLSRRDRSLVPEKYDIHTTLPGSKLYGEVMKAKFTLAKKYCDNDTIYVNVDDDYFYNGYVFKWVKYMFENHNEIDYLTLIQGWFDTKPKDMSGFEMTRVGSCLGGSICARWSVFKKHMEGFLKNHGTNNMWDCGNPGFFDYVREVTGEIHPIFMSTRFSLAQHCNLKSNYLNSKHNKSVWEHSYSHSFDPLMDPFYLADTERSKK